ncbi:MAG: aminodeoxychorismate/anthranilate synthase component II [Planctomycetota bacterium]
MILLIDNYDSFTWNLVQRLGELDPSLEPERDLVVVRNDRITPEAAMTLGGGRGPSHVIVSPGPCTPNEAGVSSDIIGAFAGRVPVLGVCLGHQCLGDLNGMNVVRHPTPMHGKTSPVHHDGRGLFAGINSPMTAMRYHSLVIDVASIPTETDSHGRGWTVSAWADEELDNGTTRRVVMGLRRRWGGNGSQAPLAPLEGVQFHPESFMTPDGPRLLANYLRMGERPRAVDDARIGAIAG